MNKDNIELIISTPGRICLFGEHQDYLGLPVIASAISLRIFIEGSYKNGNLVNISLPDIHSSESFSINGTLNYQAERDYFKSAVNVLLQNGFTFSRGLECKVYGQIPINAGTSSSSAMIVTWINLLTRLSDQAVILKPGKIAEYAYKAEVEEFSEPGGMMDHYSTAVGGIIVLKSWPELKLSKIKTDLGAFVLGNSKEPKDTKYILSRVKNEITSIIKILRNRYPELSLNTTDINQIDRYRSNLNDMQFELLKGTLINRDITDKAEEVLERNFNKENLGKLMYKHQTILRDILKISTLKIDKMVDAAMKAGALGAKINGSGGGGCMFAYAPENPEQVYEEVRKISDEVYIIYPDEGTREEVLEKVNHG